MGTSSENNVWSKSKLVLNVYEVFLQADWSEVLQIETSGKYKKYRKLAYVVCLKKSN
jgi:hypothetical protein